MANKKYEITKESKIIDNRILYRIVALKKFDDIYEGQKGGFIEKESNLSQEGNCWVYDDSCIYGNAQVYGNSKIYDESLVYDYAVVENSRIAGSKIYSSANVFNSHVYKSVVRSYARLYDALVEMGACIESNIQLTGPVQIHGNVTIRTEQDYIVFKNWWGSGRHFTWTRENNMWNVGCFMEVVKT